MLDLLELIGIDFDGLDTGQSIRWKKRVFRRDTKEESLCSCLFRRRFWPAVALIGYWHCKRSYDRYN